MSSSNNSTNCFDQYNTNGYVAVVAIRAVAGSISVVCCLAVIALIVLFKKYKFFTQRLILYLTISTLAYSLVSILNVAGYKAYTSTSLQNYCVFIGFLEQVMSCWIPMAITCIVVDLFVKVIINKATDKLEILYGLIIFASPLTYSLIPFKDLAYGQAGAWCWIRDHDYDDCEKFDLGTALRFTLYWVPLVIIMVVLTVLLVVTVVFLRIKQQKWEGKFDPEVKLLRKRMRKEVIPLISYPIIFLALNIFPLANRIANIESSKPIIVLWLLAAISLPLQGLVITIAFVVDPETRSKLTLLQLAGAARNLCSSEGEITEYQIYNKDQDKEREIEYSTYDYD